MLTNEKGSVMSVAVIMIALLSFALTSVTAYSFRTAENTNRTVESNELSNRGKRLVSEAMVRFEEAVEQLVEDEGSDIISEGRETEFWDEMFPVVEDIEDELGVKIRESEEKIDGALESLDVGSKAFRFAYPLTEERSMVKYLFLSDYGTEWEAYDAFQYSIGSSENVVINGGGYNQSADIYGHRLYNGYSTAYKETPDSGYTVFEAGTYNYPSGEDLTFTSPNYHYCEVGVSEPCMSTDASDNLVIEEGQYTQYEDDDNNYFSDLLTGFDYDKTFYSNLEEKLEVDTLLNEDNYETELNDMIDEGTLSELSEGSETFTLTDTYNTLSDHTIIQQDTLINMGNNDLDLNGNTLIILGDLTIESVNAIHAPGQVYVFGDILFDNDQDLRTNVNYYSTEDIEVTFDRGDGFELYESGNNNEGMALFAGGNVEINHSNTFEGGGGSRLAMMIIAQGSVKIDSAIEEFHIGGAIYAQGRKALDDVYMNSDGTLEAFEGLIINSFNGQDIDTDPSPGNYNEDDDGGDSTSGKPGVNPGGKPKGNSGKTHDDTEHLFSFNALANSTPGQSPSENLEESFEDLPDFKQLVIIPTDGEILSDSSTFLYEQRESEEE
ncbi:MAG: hypothetical protein ACOCSM_03635 [Bacillota bacterium]